MPLNDDGEKMLKGVRFLMGSDAGVAIISLLFYGRAMYGLEMVKESGGQLKRGTIYVYLRRMEQQGLISSEVHNNPVNEGAQRRRYRITALGKRALISSETARRLVGLGSPVPA